MVVIIVLFLLGTHYLFSPVVRKIAQRYSFFLIRAIFFHFSAKKVDFARKNVIFPLLRLGETVSVYVGYGTDAIYSRARELYPQYGMYFRFLGLFSSGLASLISSASTASLSNREIIG